MAPHRAFDSAYFEQQYRNYERQNPARKLEFYRRLAERAAGARANPRILDIGCAFGLFLSHLGSRWDRVGVDMSSYAIDGARASVAGVDFRVSRPGEVPATGPFDVITAFDVLEHIPDFASILSYAASNLTPGGGFIFVVPVYDGPTGPIIKVLDKDPTHVHRVGREVWLDAASRHFTLVEWWGIFRYLVGGRLYVHFVSRTLRRFSPAIACLMRRPE